MARFTAILIACLAIGAAYAQEPRINKTSTTVAPTPVTETTTTLKPTVPTTTTTAKTTTESSTTESTSTTTTATTTTTTTSAPSNTTSATTTTSSPTTTKAPLPSYPNNGQLWFVNKTEQQPCLAFKAALGIKQENETTSVPTTATTTGSNCSDGSISFLLTWDEGSVQFTVINGSETKKDVYWFANATVTLKGVEYDMSNTSEVLFKTPVDASYKCQSETTVELTKGTKLLVSSLQTEAFSSKPAEPHFSFSSAQECKADDVSAVVPVTVGVALIVLVVIVLVAYIIGRKRSRSRGYQSV